MCVKKKFYAGGAIALTGLVMFIGVNQYQNHKQQMTVATDSVEALGNLASNVALLHTIVSNGLNPLKEHQFFEKKFQLLNK